MVVRVTQREVFGTGRCYGLAFRLEIEKTEIAVTNDARKGKLFDVEKVESVVQDFGAGWENFSGERRIPHDSASAIAYHLHDVLSCYVNPGLRVTVRSSDGLSVGIAEDT
jgi:hypothetical protein